MAWIASHPARPSQPRRPSSARASAAPAAADARDGQDAAELARTLARPPAPTGRRAAIPFDRAVLHHWHFPVDLKAAPAEPTDVRFPINLATALRLSDARPLIVAAAQARVWVAEAELTQAKVLWLPDLNIGFDYIRHDGGGPDFNKGIMTAPSTNFFYAGAGLWGNDLGIIHTTDAIYQPLVARQVLNAEHWSVQTAKNDALLRDRRRLLHGAPVPGIYAGSLYTVERAATWSTGSPPSAATWSPPSRSTGPATCWPTSRSSPSRRGSSGGCRAPGSPECCGSTPARWSSPWSTTTPRSPSSTRPGCSMT